MLLKKGNKISEQIIFLNTTLTAIAVIVFSLLSYTTFTIHNLKKEIFEMNEISIKLFQDFRNTSISEIENSYKELIYEGKEEVLIHIQEKDKLIFFGKKLGYQSISSPEGWYYSKADGLYKYKKILDGNRQYYFFRNIELEEIFANGLKLLLIDLFFIVISYFIISIGAKKILKPISELIEDAKKIDEHNLDIRLPQKTNDELGELVEVINKSIEKIQKAYYSQKYFTHNASHELKTPLAVMKGYLEILHWGKNNENLFEEALINIEGEVENMRDIIEKLFFISRLEKIELIPTAVKTNDLFNKVLNDYRIMGVERIKIENASVDLFVDFKLLLEAIRAIVDNALKFSEGIIILDSYKKNDFYYISITDFGIGIEESQINRIKERFYKIDESRSQINQGLGLGLSIVDEIIKAHGGKLMINSSIGKGSSFVIELPTL